MKTKTIPFDLETAKKIQAGEIKGKIVMRCGYEVRIVCWDSTVKYLEYTQPIIAQEEGDGDLYAYFESGRYIAEEENSKDLVLEVPDNEPQFKPFDKVLVKSEEDNLWMCALFSHMSNIDGFPYSANNFLWKYCIPYEGNEHLVGTTNNPE